MIKEAKDELGKYFLDEDKNDQYGYMETEMDMDMDDSRDGQYGYGR